MKRKPTTVYSVAVLVAIATSGPSTCLQTIKDYARELAPSVVCEGKKRTYANWVAQGRPVDVSSRSTAAVVRAGIERLHVEAREWCASKGIVI